MYKISIQRDAEKALSKIPKTDQKRIIKRIDLLAENPLPPDVKNLQGDLGGYHRIRSGNYRIIYEIFQNELMVLILKIGHRQNIYT